MSMQHRFANPGFLPRLLRVDGLATGATALLLIAGADMLAPLLALPAGLLRIAGLICVPFVAWVLLLSRHARVPRLAMVAVVAINFAWVAASAWVAFGPVWQPTGFGIVFVCAQALVVLVFAELGWMGLHATRQGRTALA
ncbi:hypothetical protein [Marilutibacter alkalisoli]|uniref:Uncharacterized protein n=1 Tax=Marilutibacter alkalisoli TaxID=2591633 RepID=A0A514BSD7_9GAMM|nr:hypothetical protein [Lysobacter alkalisoli]QDH70290.1 hypothetical protein FKV23_09465 [Lysobacter alkalisoli]